MRTSIKSILTVLLLSTLVFSCKKSNIAPDAPQTPPVTIVDSIPVDTTTAPTPTTAVNINTVTVSFTMKTISGNYGGVMVPAYYGAYKVDFLIYKNGAYAPSIQPAQVVLNCTCNPRTITIPGFKAGDTVTIYWGLLETGSTNHIDLPSVTYNYKQINNGYDNGNHNILQSKQGNLTFTIQ